MTSVYEESRPQDFLATIALEEESLYRKERSAKVLKTRARFRSDAELCDWDHEFSRGFTKAQFKECASLRFFENS